MENDHYEIDLKAIVALLRRQARLIILTVILVVGLALTYLFAVTPIYTASTLVLIDPAQRDLLGSTEQRSSADAANARVDGEVEILRSDVIALAVLDEQNLINDPEFRPQISLMERIQRALGFEVAERHTGEGLVQRALERFQRAVSIRRVGLTYIISVSVDSTDPERAALLSNALAETYIAAQVESKISVILTARDVLQSQIDIARQSVTTSEDSLDEFIASNLAQLEEESGRAEIAQLRNLLEQNAARRLSIEVSAEEAQRALQVQNWAELTNRLGDEALDELNRQREQLQLQLSDTVMSSQEEIDLRSALAQVETDIRNRAGSTIGELRVEVAGLEASARDYRAQIRDELLQGELSPTFLTAIYELQQESGIARRQYETLLSRLREFEIQASVQVADARIVAPALPPDSVTSPNSELIIALSLVVSIVLGVGFAVLRDYFVGGVTSADQLRGILRTKVASAIPHTPLDASQRSLADQIIASPLSHYAESIRRLRATIDQSIRKRSSRNSIYIAKSKGRVVLVTSSIPYEGKTTTSLAIARTYATSGKKTLLIDADLRKPSIHTHLGLVPKESLIDFLSAPENEDQSSIPVEKDPISALSVVLGSGHSDVSTDQLLDSDRFDALIRQCRDDFDIIILDSPPVIPVVDARYIAHRADVVLLLVGYAFTRQADVRMAVQPLTEAMNADAELFSVLNQDQSRHAQYRYDGYY